MYETTVTALVKFPVEERKVELLLKFLEELHGWKEKEWIKEQLFEYFWKEISRGITKGLPEWYKEQLVKGQFNG